MIYFIACSAANAVKIGVTDKRSYMTTEQTAYARLSQAQVGCPHELELLATCDGSKAEEAALHARFAEHRIRGEWFTLTDELRGHIAQFSKPERLARGWHSQVRNRSSKITVNARAARHSGASAPEATFAPASGAFPSATDG